MAYLIGTDEAGYGPNLGPLVISATAWEVPDDVAADTLYDRLADVVRPDVTSLATEAEQRVVIADSKALYQSGKSLERLESGVLAALRMLDIRPGEWTELWRALVPGQQNGLDGETCYRGFRCQVPLASEPDRLDRLGRAWRAGCETVGVRLRAIHSHPVFPATFNRLIEQHGTKGAALSQLTFGLIYNLLDTLPAAPVSIVCDKHGGRNRYGPLLQSRFTESLVEVVQETKLASRYRWGPTQQRVQIEIRARGEGCLPVALASMVSKYLRELAMQAFNAYWLRRIPLLRPTAGYPVDARRFKRDIAAVQRDLGMEDRVLWRAR